MLSAQEENKSSYKILTWMRNCVSRETAEQFRGTKCIKYIAVVNLIQWHFL